MLTSFIHWLKTPYYFNPSIKFKFKISLIFGFFVFLFLYLLEPFNLSDFKEYLFVYTFYIGLISFFGNLFFLTIPPLIFRKFFNEDHWTIGKNILLMIIGIITIGSILWYLDFYFKSYKMEGIDTLPYGTYLYYTFLVGTFPIFFGVYMNERNLRLKRAYWAKEININKREATNKHKEKKDLKQVVIKSNNQKNNIKFYINELVYINCQGNYTSFFILNKSNELKEKILRISLNSSFDQLKMHKNIIKCHKSYIVNLDHITKFSGNARGYLLHSKYMENLIPVSRSFNKALITELLNKD